MPKALVLPMLATMLRLQPRGVLAEEISPPAPPGGGLLCTPMRRDSCWHNPKPSSHLATLSISAGNETAAACLCFGNCSATAGCKHWHVKTGEDGFECDLRTADVWAGTGTCTSDTNPVVPAPPGPSPPGPGPPPGPYRPQPPVPPPGPPPPPALGFKPHLIFNLVDDGARAHTTCFASNDQPGFLPGSPPFR